MSRAKQSEEARLQRRLKIKDRKNRRLVQQALPEDLEMQSLVQESVKATFDPQKFRQRRQVPTQPPPPSQPLMSDAKSAHA